MIGISRIGRIKPSPIMFIAMISLLGSIVSGGADGADTGTAKNAKEKSSTAGSSTTPSAASPRPDWTHPISLEDPGENWRYAREADKIPEIRQAMTLARPESNPNLPRLNTPAFCKTFKEDFLAGRYEVLEPQLQITTPSHKVEDPRLDPRWHNCEGKPRSASVAKEDWRVFYGLAQYVQAPGTRYRFYPVPIDTHESKTPSDIVAVQWTVRDQLSTQDTAPSYSQEIDWVNLVGCEIRGSHHSRYSSLSKLARQLIRNHPVTLSTLIRYQERVMVLESEQWPSYGIANNKPTKPGDPKYYVVELRDLSHDQDLCRWSNAPVSP